MKNINDLLDNTNNSLENIIEIFQELMPGKLVENLNEEKQRLQESVPGAISMLRKQITSAIYDTALISKSLLSGKELSHHGLQTQKILNYVYNVQTINGYIHLTKHEYSNVDLSEMKVEIDLFWNAHIDFETNIEEYNKKFPGKPLITIEQTKKELEELT